MTEETVQLSLPCAAGEAHTAIEVGKGPLGLYHLCFLKKCAKFALSLVLSQKQILVISLRFTTFQCPAAIL